MNKCMRYLILILFIVIGSFSFGQDKDVPFDKKMFLNNKKGFNEAIENVSIGDLHFLKGSGLDLATALTYYLKADEFNHYSTSLNYKIGVCYLSSTQKFNALDYLIFAKEKSPKNKQYEDINFYLGQAYHLNGEWNKAIEYYSIYKIEEGNKDKVLAFFVNKKMSECKTGQALSGEPIRVWIDNLGPEVNSKHSDFGPVVSADNKILFFTSRRPGGTGDESDEKGMSFEDIYFSKRKVNGDWIKAENLGEPVNSKSHDAAVGLSPDGKSLLIYQGVSKKTGNILITKQNEDSTWSPTAEIEGDVNSKYHETDATFSFNEKTLYFVSDRSGGFGKHDIYVTHWNEENNKWGKSENVGPTLNTEFDEKGVFFHPDNKTLYFSSQGHNTMGGLDIFKSEFDSELGTWSVPENIGSPINTPDDDVYFVTSGNEKYAYYSSYRADGFGEKDIYQVTFLGDEKEPLVTSIDDIDILDDDLSVNGEFVNRPLVMIKGKVIDGNTKEPLVSTVSITDGKINKKIVDVVTEEDGYYMYVVDAGKEYALSTTLPGYTVASEIVKTRKSDNGTEYVIDLELFPPVTGGEFVLRNIYYTFNKSNLRNKSVEDLDLLIKVMNENPTLKIELGGHTDSRGPEWSNRRLSRERAEAAKKYLISKKIDPNRLTSKGYGEVKLQISDAEINLMSTNKEKEAAHQKNRRTIVTITSK